VQGEREVVGRRGINATRLDEAVGVHEYFLPVCLDPGGQRIAETRGVVFLAKRRGTAKDAKKEKKERHVFIGVLGGLCGSLCVFA